MYMLMTHSFTFSARPSATEARRMTLCIAELDKWMSLNWLRPNSDKPSSSGFICGSNWSISISLAVSVVQCLGRLTCDEFNSAFHPSGVCKPSTSLLAGVKAGRVHLCQAAGNTV